MGLETTEKDMDIEEALRWVDRNCTDAATLDRLRSRKVAKTLCDEIELLRDKLEKATTEHVMLLGELENARSNDRCTFGYLSEIRNAAGHVGDFPSLVQAIQTLANKTHNAKVTGSPALSASPRGLPG